MVEAPEHIKSITPYVPGKPLEELKRQYGISNAVKLASNENPLGPSPKALDAIAINERLEHLNRYPEGSGYLLINTLSKKYGIERDQIILGNGSNEVIELLVRTFLLPTDEVIVASPSFVVYDSITQAAGGRSIVIPLKKWCHDLKAMAQAMTEKTKLIFIANPNNPTGTINNKEEMEELLEKVPKDVIVAVDEAYYEYVTDQSYPDSLEYIKSGHSIVVFRTFSKIYGLAGLRIGYGLADSAIIQEMHKIRQPFNTNTLAQYAALAAIEDTKHVKMSQELNEEGKKYLYEQFQQIGIDFVETEANFIFLPLRNAYVLYEKLLKNGVIVRPISSDGLRITIGLPDENKRFIEALRQIIHS